MGRAERRRAQKCEQKATVIGRTYSSDLLRDSNGDVIEGRAIFVIK